MITKEQALDLAKKYLQQKKRNYSKIDTELDKIFYSENHLIGYNQNEKEILKNIYSVGYEVESMDIIYYVIIIDADTGEVIKTLGPHGTLESRE